MINLPCFIVLLLMMSLAIGLTLVTGDSDEVKSLPGVNFSLPFKHYSGYLEALDGNQFFYWFFESQQDPSKDPVMLWLNGGPGCSSMGGALTENGPLRLVSNQTVEFNPFAWNIRASVLYLESPAGVGFSYSSKGNYTTNDDWTAENNLAALKSFYEKFPYLMENEFYITGESYAGIYIPTLSMLCLKAKFPPNFRGFAIGNGLLDTKQNENSLLHFYYYHGFIDNDQWIKLLSSCCSLNLTDFHRCDFVDSQSKVCQNFLKKVYYTISSANFNSYNIYEQPQKKDSLMWKNRNLRSQQKILTNFGKVVPDSTVEAYLNQPEVKQALHVRSQSFSPWLECSGRSHYWPTYQTMQKQVRHLLQSGLKGLIYNGDFDSVCNFLGGMWFSEDLGFRTIHPLKPWNVEGYGMGGMVKQFEHFYFVTVRGAGHFVPTDRPAQALHMIYQFLIDS